MSASEETAPILGKRRSAAQQPPEAPWAAPDRRRPSGPSGRSQGLLEPKDTDTYIHTYIHTYILPL
eukprot:2727700-Heterocapsa_arctica.AAC.1